jgi:pyridoxine kinase
VMKNVLSIHSSVTVGFVGNNVVGPVLTALDLAPLLVPTVMLAAHPGYGRRVGDAVPDHIVADVLAGLGEMTEIGQIAAVVSGYLGSVGQTDAIAGFIDAWRTASAGSYILDPVLGDRGRLYLSEELAQAMIERLLPRADIITPNMFELGFLTGMPVSCLATAEPAARQLVTTHRLQAVIATGIDNGPAGVGDLLVPRSGDSLWRAAGSNGHNVAGGGDLLTAILAGQLARGVTLEPAFETASRTTQEIIAASASPRDLALLEYLGHVAALTDRTQS